VQLDVVVPRILPRAGGGLAHVQLVVDVHVRAVRLRLEKRNRLAGEGQRDGLVAEPGSVTVRDDGSLVADDRVGKAGRSERTPNGLHHPTGDDDHVQPGCAGSLERGDRAGVQRPVLPDKRAVEVGRDDADVARKLRRERDQPFGLPPVALTT
jgi:hypothetical protein